MILEALVGFLQVLDPIGSGLSGGVQLVYESGGAAQAPWVYASVRVEPRAAFARCVVVAREGQPERESCERGDTLFERQEAGEYRAVRPIGPDMELEVRTASGSVVLYSTGGASTRRIGDQPVAYVPTTIVTRNVEGVVVRRLREHYAPSLLTALWGVFEEPTADGGWRTTLEFSLTRIGSGAAVRGDVTRTASVTPNGSRHPSGRRRSTGFHAATCRPRHCAGAVHVDLVRADPDPPIVPPHRPARDPPRTKRWSPATCHRIFEQQPAFT